MGMDKVTTDQRMALQGAVNGYMDNDATEEDVREDVDSFLDDHDSDNDNG